MNRRQQPPTAAQNSFLAHTAIILSLLLITLLFVGWAVLRTDSRLELCGRLGTKHSKDISSSPWGIQAGTLDEEIVRKAGEIGVKWTRLQTSWSSIEKQKGVYNWAETDKAFSVALAQGITPFVTIGGSNGLYVKTRTNLDPKLVEIYGTHPLPPTSDPAAMEAWLKFVEKVVERYKGTIKYWEIWNEPNHFAYWGDEPNGKEYGRLLHASAKIVRETDPTAFVLAGATAGLDPEFTDAFLSVDNKALVDIITFHNYGPIPEERIYKALQVWDVINKYNPSIQLWQGECGYPSHSSTRDYRGISPWGPLIQAKWLLRQAFTDTYYCRTSMSNYFKLHHEGGRGKMPRRSFLTSIDSILGFPERAGSRVKVVGVNEKCILENPGLNPKPAFYAYQNLCALMDGRYKRFETRSTTTVLDPGIFYGIGSEDDAFPSVPLVASYRSENGSMLLAYWLPWHPLELIKAATVNVTVNNITMNDPVLIDPLSGEVFNLAEVTRAENKIVFKNIPLADYPFILVERNQVEIRMAQ